MKTPTTKITFILMAALLLSAAVIGSTAFKIKPKTITDLQGKWQGKMGMGTKDPDGYFGIMLQPNGTLTRINNAGNITATGTWKLDGENLHGTYQFLDDSVTVNISGTIDPSIKTFEGTWNNEGDNKGTFSLNKK